MPGSKWGPMRLLRHPSLSGRNGVPFGAAGLLPVLAILGASLLVLAGCDRNSANPPSPTPGTETETVTQPQLVGCPPQVGQAVCNFAAAAPGWLQGRDLGKLVGAGGPMDTPENRTALLQTIDTGLVPADSPPTLRSVACPVGHDPITGILPASCEKAFSLIFATADEKALTATGGVISLGYAISAAGPQLVGHLVVATSQRTWVLRGPNASGCPVAGTEQNPNQCFGVTVYPVEVLGPGQTPVAVGGVETIAGAQVKQLKMGPEAPLPKDLVVYVFPAPYATDANPALLWREYRDAKGEIRRDDLFANLKTQLGPVAIVSWVGDERMGQIVVVSCPAEHCHGTGVGGWAGEFDVYRSIDGGITWSSYPPTPNSSVPAMSFPDAVTSDGVLMSQFTGRDQDESIIWRFYLHPGGQEVAAPAPRVTPRIVPGFGLVWEWDGTENKGYAPFPNYDGTGAMITQAALTPAMQAHLIGRTADGSAYAKWQYVKDRAADPHPVTVYLGRVDSKGKPIELFTSAPIDLTVYRLPFLAATDLLLTNVDLHATSGFDVPAALVDLRTGLVEPVRDLSGGLTGSQQPLVVGALPGPVLRVVTGSDCLNVRQNPSATATTRGCFKDGVLLADRGQTTVADGATWVAVTTPLGDPGWASSDFLER
jgi:hypothetical protein